MIPAVQTLHTFPSGWGRPLGLVVPGLLLLLSSPGPAAGPPPAPTLAIKVDQVGYLPGAPKVALVVSEAAAGSFLVRRAGDGAVVFRGTLGAPREDPDAGDSVRAADFSALKTEGRFYVDAPGAGVSWPFAVAPDAYSRALYLAMRSFYGQRCGTAVDLGPEFPGYRHDACHLENAYHATSGRSGAKSSGNKGWHDAGDYGRYVVNSGISTGTLLWTYELFADRVKNVRLNLPESGNGTPDILNEIRWNLDWMRSMQDEDGGVFHKQTSERFCDFVMPEKDTLVSYVIGTGAEPYKSTCATADFAAVMAAAARIYRPFDAAFAATALESARKAFAWAGKNPGVLFNNPKGIGTGAYGDRSCGDEILWAAAELWRTTREGEYEQYFAGHYAPELARIRAVGPPAWANVAPMALWTYGLGGGTGAAADAIRQASVAAADEIARRTAADPYRTSLATADYIWGSNSVAANYGLQLLVANALAPNPRYREAAADTLHYLLGRNTFSLSWVTQVGANPFKHPHHRPSGADQNPEPWPGLLAGGPNGHRQDPAMNRLPPGLPPAKMYLDDQESYATNEVAINWNAPLVLLLADQLPAKPVGARRGGGRP
jgi:endoglucanase